MTFPLPSSSGPPELPGLIAASVWIASMNDVCPSADPPAVTGRCSALTIPLVTVPDRPSGEPTAITESPTATADDSPRVSAGRPDLSTFTTAMS